MAAPQVTTEAPTLIGKDSVTFNAVLVSTGGKACVGRFWYTREHWQGWSPSPWQSLGGDGSSFSHHHTDSTPKRQHQYWAEVANEDGSDTGLVLKFWFKWKQPPYDGSPFFAYQYQAVGPYQLWTITCKTDIACRMTMWFDNGVPYAKTGEHFKRGKVYMHTPLIYFRPKWNVVQEESGDSLTHTFLWTCKKPYGKYFHQGTATVDGRLSPSKTPFYRVRCKPAPPPVETSDQCTWANNNSGSAQWWNAMSQTFTPDHDYTLSSVSLRLNEFPDRRGWYFVKICKVDGSACQSEPILWSCYKWSPFLPPFNSQQWTNFGPINIPLTQGVQYRIVVHGDDTWQYWTGTEWKDGWSYAGMRFWTSTNPDCYTRGMFMYGCDFRPRASGWRTTQMDVNFICWEQPG
ncbi:hypothetical protein ES708_14625 [subsurface metagenome]